MRQEQVNIVGGIILATDVIANAADAGATVKDDMSAVGRGDFHTRGVAADAEFI